MCTRSESHAAVKAGPPRNVSTVNYPEREPERFVDVTQCQENHAHTVFDTESRSRHMHMNLLLGDTIPTILSRVEHPRHIMASIATTDNGRRSYTNSRT